VPAQRVESYAPRRHHPVGRVLGSIPSCVSLRSACDGARTDSVPGRGDGSPRSPSPVAAPADVSPASGRSRFLTDRYSESDTSPLSRNSRTRRTKSASSAAGSASPCKEARYRRTAQLATAIATSTPMKTIHSVGEPLSSASNIRLRFRFIPPSLRRRREATLSTSSNRPARAFTGGLERRIACRSRHAGRKAASTFALPDFLYVSRDNWSSAETARVQGNATHSTDCNSDNGRLVMLVATATRCS
jgi:hypothetical protein